MTDSIFLDRDACYTLTPDGPKKISGYKTIATLPDGDWVMAAFGGKVIVIADRSGKHLPFVAYDDKIEQMKINEIEDGGSK